MAAADRRVVPVRAGDGAGEGELASADDARLAGRGRPVGYTSVRRCVCLRSLARKTECSSGLVSHRLVLMLKSSSKGDVSLRLRFGAQKTDERKNRIYRIERWACKRLEFFEKV